MTATDAFYVKQTMHETLHTKGFHDFAVGYTRSMRGEAKENALPINDPELDFIASSDAYVAREVRVLKMSETFYVSPLMSKMVTAAAETWPEDEPVMAEDFPTPHGFMWIPGGVSTLDVRGQMNTTVAFAWEQRGGYTTVTWWTDKRYDNPLQQARSGWDAMPQYTPWHATVLNHGTSLPVGFAMGTVIPPEVGAQMKWVETEAGVGLTFPMGWTPEQLQPGWRVDRTSAWLVSALRIMQQPLASVERKGMPANVRKGLERRPVRLKQKAVTVIDFRRRVGDFEHHGAREYSHRFLRRGHWRRQPYKCDDGTWDRRRIWIHPTIVGDPDKPLVLRNHVNALMR